MGYQLCLLSSQKYRATLDFDDQYNNCKYFLDTLVLRCFKGVLQRNIGYKHR